MELVTILRKMLKLAANDVGVGEESTGVPSADVGDMAIVDDHVVGLLVAVAAAEVDFRPEVSQDILGCVF